VLTDRGVAQPGIYGPALDGKHGTVLIKDTDAGQYDRDSRFDRAVGPMQFIPSTWAIVGVDADNDGQRNPQDIYDAALGSAVYLCSGPDDLSTTSGQRSAVYRYNHSQKYVDLVLAIERAYLAGNYSSVPNGTTTTSFSLGNTPLVHDGVHHRHHHHGHHHGHHGDQPDERSDDRADRRAHPGAQPGLVADAADPAGHGPRGRSDDLGPAASDTDDPDPGRGDRAVPGRGADRQPARPSRRVRPVRVQPHPLTLAGGGSLGRRFIKVCR
jgi:hypothetical protein